MLSSSFAYTSLILVAIPQDQRKLHCEPVAGILHVPTVPRPLSKKDAPKIHSAGDSKGILPLHSSPFLPTRF
ncbi:hypothetical protein COLO4_06394 [Corchorus olitorius]|uniref:Uncharacterized protein n=1 Tax=Corchorus olitorius TaxID=93759 RepID=A0A1R3KN45_9ROSI|nr:hypothetical protein COLO4_06394 [Corchorus olitorius]